MSKVVVGLLSVVCMLISSCTSMPSLYKLRDGESSLGVNLRVAQYQNKPFLTFDIDGRIAINEHLDIGVTVVPGVLLNVVSPYIVGKYGLNEQTGVMGDIQFPVVIGLLDVEPGFGIWPFFAIGASLTHSIDDNHVVSVGSGYDSTRDHTMAGVALDAEKDAKERHSNVLFRIGHVFHSERFIMTNTFIMDAAGNPMYYLGGIFTENRKP